MMTIRKAQFQAIGERLSRRWEDTMVVHLETFFPERCQELGEAGVRGAIELGLKKAARYDIRSERDVCKFLNFMFAYHFHFDTDPDLPWANAILTDPNLTRSNVKTHLLEKAANGELEPEPEGVPDPTEAEFEAIRVAIERESAERAKAAEDAAEAAARGSSGPNRTGEGHGQ